MTDLGLGALALVALAAASSTPTPPHPFSTQGDWREVLPGTSIEFPRDHGSHPSHRTEWWYFTGHLEDEQGRDVGFQFTIFRSGIDARPIGDGESKLRARQVFAGHLALADIEGQSFHFAERLRRATPGFAQATVGDLDVQLEDWSIRRVEGDRLHLIGFGGGGEFGIDVFLEPRKAIVLQGDRGYSQKGPEAGNASGYTSWTRLAASGTLRLDGEERTVAGQTWYDHEWGTSQLGDGVVGWDWFSLQLDDQRELMVYGLRRKGGSFDRYSSGTLVEADGSSRRLGPDEFVIQATDQWVSPRTGGVYPSGWIVEAAGLKLRITPELKGCELITEGSTGVSYWEGPVRIEGDATGCGYVELTGYADSLEKRF